MILWRAKEIIFVRHKESFVRWHSTLLSPSNMLVERTFYLLGRGVRLKVEKNVQETISSNGIYLYLCVKNPNDYEKKKRMVDTLLG